VNRVNQVIPVVEMISRYTCMKMYIICTSLTGIYNMPGFKDR